MAEQLLDEFGRQAANMDAAPAFKQEKALRRICAALGPAPIGRVLELACGPGIVAEAIAPLVSELVCIDATPEMLALAKARIEKTGLSNVTFQQAFAEALPFGAAEFDVIVTRLSFHHFNDIQTILAECRRVLRPHGRLVTADVISSVNREESTLHNALEQLRDPTHVHMLSRPEFLITLHAAGFEPTLEESWEQQRCFSEWARIVAVPGRTEPLREVMRTLSRSGVHAGIQLHEAGGDIQFVHTWLLVAAEPIISEDTEQTA
ncbi:MAG: methyltransferase domain-containing protein [Burkholderiaceae bacterium]|nr:methyltransferase domain-containing protein [Burkholderiaceae bacterium]